MRTDKPIDDLIAEWHATTPDGVQLHEYLGMTWEEYVEHFSPAEVHNQGGGAMSTGNFWWAEKDADGWKPTLQFATGVVSLNVWFTTKEECERFIEEEILTAEAE